jgi:hypothetical protein
MSACPFETREIMITEIIIDELKKFDPAQREWKDLDALIEKASEHSGEDIVKALLNLFKRFPEHEVTGFSGRLFTP